MKIYKSKLAQTENQYPTQYEMEKIKYIRRNQQTTNHKQEKLFKRLEKGVQGEKMLIEKIQKYGRKNWMILENVWLNYYGTFEIDLLLGTQANWYPIEVKNLQGDFSYKNGNCYLNNKKIGNNFVTQARRAHSNLQNICQQANISCHPRGTLFLINEHNWIGTQDKTEDLTILTRNQSKHFFQQIKQEEDRHFNHTNQKTLIKTLETFETQNPFAPKPINTNDYRKLQKGIHCTRCAKFQLTLTRHYATCLCGMREPREQTILRIIHEYGVLHYDKNLTIENLLDFFNHEISRSSLKRVLNKYFEHVNKTRYSYYLNKKIPYERQQLKEK